MVQEESRAESEANRTGQAETIPGRPVMHNDSLTNNTYRGLIITARRLMSPVTRPLGNNVFVDRFQGRERREDVAVHDQRDVARVPEEAGDVRRAQTDTAQPSGAGKCWKTITSTVVTSRMSCLGKTEKTVVSVNAATQTVGAAGVPSAEHEREDGRGDENGICAIRRRKRDRRVPDLLFRTNARTR